MDFGGEAREGNGSGCVVWDEASVGSLGWGWRFGGSTGGVD